RHFLLPSVGNRSWPAQGAGHEPEDPVAPLRQPAQGRAAPAAPAGRVPLAQDGRGLPRLGNRPRTPPCPPRNRALRGLAPSPSAVRAPAAAAARGDTLLGGPRHELKTPSAAARVARDGDVVEIEPG